MTFQPGHWVPPPAPKLAQKYQQNSLLASASLFHVGTGPEDVVVDRLGRVYAGLVDGQVVRFDLSGGNRTTVANTAGRPLGLEFDPQGRLIICDAKRGLLRLTDNNLEALVTEVNGKPLKFTNNASVATDGSIYFSDSSQHYGIENYKVDLLEHAGTGRLLVYRPSGEVEILLEGLHFANGVALDAMEASVLVVETGRYLIRRLWLTGNKAGQDEVFVDNLPGFPDNLSRHEDTFWVAIPSPRDLILDKMLPHPWVRRFVAMLPDQFHPKVRRYGFAIGLSHEARVTHNLQDAEGRVAVVSGVRQFEDKLVLGSLTETQVAVCDLS